MINMIMIIRDFLTKREQEIPANISKSTGIRNSKSYF